MPSSLTSTLEDLPFPTHSNTYHPDNDRFIFNAHPKQINPKAGDMSVTAHSSRQIFVLSDTGAVISIMPVLHIQAGEETVTPQLVCCVSYPDQDIPAQGLTTAPALFRVVRQQLANAGQAVRSTVDCSMRQDLLREISQLEDFALSIAAAYGDDTDAEGRCSVYDNADPAHAPIFAAYAPLLPSCGPHQSGVLVLTDPTTTVGYADSSGDLKAACSPSLVIGEENSTDVEVLGVSADAEYGGPETSLRQRVESYALAGARRLVDMAQLAAQSQVLRDTAGQMSCNGSTIAMSPPLDRGLLGMRVDELPSFFKLLTAELARTGQEGLGVSQAGQGCSLAMSSLGHLGETCMPRQHFEGTLNASGGP